MSCVEYGTDENTEWSLNGQQNRIISVNSSAVFWHASVSSTDSTAISKADHVRNHISSMEAYITSDQTRRWILNGYYAAIEINKK
jgi:hypothetical protein